MSIKTDVTINIVVIHKIRDTENVNNAFFKFVVIYTKESLYVYLQTLIIILQDDVH